MNLNALTKTAALAVKIADSRHATVSGIPQKPQKKLSARAPIEQAFPKAMPFEQGIESGVLCAFLRRLAKDPTLHMHTVLVLQNGKEIARAAFENQSFAFAKSTFSACKSITALAVGMLWDEKKLSVQDKVLSFFESLSPVAKLKYREMTVQDLLTMRSSSSFAEMDAMAEAEWTRAFFSATSVGTHGIDFQYNSLNTYILSAIVQKITGQTLFAFLSERLFAPLGITDVFWESSPEGITKGGWGLYLRPDDLAKIGQLILDEGLWRGTRLLSAAWIRKMTRTYVKSPVQDGCFDYGYHIWTDEENDAFLLNGMLGQNVLALRRSRILIVSNAGNDELFQSSNYFTIVKELFYGLMPKELSPDEKGTAALRAQERAVWYCRGQLLPEKMPPQSPLQRLAAHFMKRGQPTEKAALPPQCFSLAERVFYPAQSAGEDASLGLLPMVLQILQNNYAQGFSDLSFSVRGDAFFVRYAQRDEVHLLRVGFTAPYLQKESFHGEEYWISTYARFAENEDGEPVLILRILFHETACIRVVKLFFGAQPRLEQSEQPGAGFVQQNIVQMLGTYAQKPLIGGALSHINEEYIAYRVKNVFAPQIALTTTLPEQRGGRESEEKTNA